MPIPSLPSFESIQAFDDMRRNLDIGLFKAAASEITKKHELPDAALELFPDGSNVIFAHGVFLLLLKLMILVDHQEYATLSIFVIHKFRA